MTKKKNSFDPLCYFEERNYELSASVGRDGAVLRSASTVLDTGVGPNSIYNRRIDLAWHSPIRPIQSPRLPDGSIEVMKSCGFIYLTVCIGEFRARVTLLVVQNLPLDCLLCGSSIVHHVKSILPGLQKCVLYHSSSVPATGQRAPTEPKTSLTFEIEDGSRKI